MNRDTFNKLITDENLADIPILYLIRILLAITELDDV